VSTSVVPSDIEIAQRVKMRPIEDVAAELGLERDELDLYGKYKAKIPLDIAQRPVRGRLVVVTATNPTPAGEGKSTVSVGLAQALRNLLVQPQRPVTRGDILDGVDMEGAPLDPGGFFPQLDFAQHTDNLHLLSLAAADRAAAE